MPRVNADDLPFPIRGTEAWDEREWRRKAENCQCISLGPLPAKKVTRRAWLGNARVMPTPARLAELRARQQERLERDSTEGREQRALASAR